MPEAEADVEVGFECCIAFRPAMRSPVVVGVCVGDVVDVVVVVVVVAVVFVAVRARGFAFSFGFVFGFEEKAGACTTSRPFASS